MIKIDIDLGVHSYPIFISDTPKLPLTSIIDDIKNRDVFIVSNETVAPLYLDQLVHNLKDNNVHTCILPDGERFKTLEVCNQIYTALLEKQLNRDVILVALGGGVIGDMVGFAAATYQRGVDFIQVPTTLLAMVDSSVGGKTAVNHTMGKNMIGAFHQPKCVLTGLTFLNSLPDREYYAGLAEVLKVALIADATFFGWIEANTIPLLSRDLNAITYIVKRACEIKANVVMQDEKELTGIRALLNLGHTYGHAIETLTEYKQYLHGEAVAIGICLAAEKSVELSMMSVSDAARIESLIKVLKLPTELPKSCSPEMMLDAMQRDKKNRQGQLNLILLKGIGSAKLVQVKS